MRTGLRRHRIVSGFLWTALALAASEVLLIYYYLSSWITLPTL